jgi:GT2 family glycosyltransferase/spore maturation protein CgeB
MKDLKFTIKDKVTSNKHLRHLRNSYKDYRSIAKYKIIKLTKKAGKQPVKESIPELSAGDIEEKYQYILRENRSLVNLEEFGSDAPLVSIIILNRDGLIHLEKLFRNFQENIEYPNYEIIVVDNASTDDSVIFLEELPLKVKIIKNTENRSFSVANNQAAEEARGEFLLLLNNDVEPTYGWLNQMMQAALRSGDVGVVGAKLVYPYQEKHPFPFKIQHMGIAYHEEDGFIKPYNLGEGLEPFDPESNEEQVRAGVTAACMMVRKELYQDVGGLDEGYLYGYEDVDFCLKLYREGYKSIYCPEALLFHHEFGTQKGENRRDIRDRRIKNRKLLSQKWGRWLPKQFLYDKLNNQRVFCERPLKVAMVVSETGEDASAGDYFTASELGECFLKLGWEVTYLSRIGPGNWYYVPGDVDVLISLLEVYDPGKIRCDNKLLIKIAWARNWFERWFNNPSIKKFDLIFASSTTACNFITEKTGKKTFLLPIATNPERFNDSISAREEYQSDYTFTGSYWDDPRDIIEMLDPYSLPYTFKLYGKNWEVFEKFKKYYQGFLNYSNLPEVYASTKIVIDDVNRGAKSFGSVNSRVFDALATGTLVVTNGAVGAEETFQGLLPVWNSAEELHSLIEYYLENDAVRKKKVHQLQEFVLENHTYQNRAGTFKEVLEQEYVFKRKITIKIPAPKWKVVQEWGDYHLAVGLKKELEMKNCEVLLQVLPEWDSGDGDCDAVIVLRGLSKYTPKKQHFNIMWNISHPDNVEIEEYNLYDQVFVASDYWAGEIMKSTSVPVEPLLQCTDPELFYSEPTGEYQNELLFVGNSRKVFRKILKDLLPTDKDLAVYGTHWKKFINQKHIKGEHIPHPELRKAYSSCKILLNDHWHDMRGKGFISNRIYDGFAAGAFIISDDVHGAGDVFGDALVTYNSREELNSLVDHYLEDESERAQKANNGQDIVLNYHTFQIRVKRILEVIPQVKKLDADEVTANVSPENSI